MSDLRVQVGSLVRHHREVAGFTQAELADRIERSVQLVGRIERGSSAPSFETLAGIASALNVEVRDLFGVNHFAAGQEVSAAPLSKLVSRVASLDTSDLEWVLKLVDHALNRRPPRRATEASSVE
ncbi:MAG: helix-turn-helix transcriptional regulator [Sphingorhabdus sp.]|uniref:helix-turn-helix domain-containing protein n=1 Tax=Sphingorhabdus sp. TaxID=1902408 RepID=UPI00345B33EB|nr:helix-turn-helix transcriptional regulator [Sphingorhabdus sp.]